MLLLVFVAQYKPYQSAYDTREKENASTEDDQSRYYCRVCEKQLNGPIPYGAHVNSKAHKEEVENAADY